YSAHTSSLTVFTRTDRSAPALRRDVVFPDHMPRRCAAASGNRGRLGARSPDSGCLVTARAEPDQLTAALDAPSAYSVDTRSDRASARDGLPAPHWKYSSGGWPRLRGTAGGTRG